MFKRNQKGLTMIGPGDTIEGTLRTRGRLEVLGEIRGDVEVEGLLCVGPQGAIFGEVHALDVAVSGRIEGSVVVSGHLHMLSTGVIDGEAAYGSLEVDRGGIIVGRTAATAAEQPAEDKPKSETAALAEA